MTLRPQGVDIASANPETLAAGSIVIHKDCAVRRQARGRFVSFLLGLVGRDS